MPPRYPHRRQLPSANPIEKSGTANTQDTRSNTRRRPGVLRKAQWTHKLHVAHRGLDAAVAIAGKQTVLPAIGLSGWPLQRPQTKPLVEQRPDITTQSARQIDQASGTATREFSTSPIARTPPDRRGLIATASRAAKADQQAIKRSKIRSQ